MRELMIHVRSFPIQGFDRVCLELNAYPIHQHINLDPAKAREIGEQLIQAASRAEQAATVTS